MQFLCLQIAVVLLSERPDAEAVLRGTATCASIKSVQMRAPPHASVIEYLALVCACEEHYVPAAMLHRLAFSCNGDLRSALQQLQFIACQKLPVGSDETLRTRTSLAVVPRHLAWLHAPAAGQPALCSAGAAQSPLASMAAGAADGIMAVLRDCDWACASLHTLIPSAATAPSGKICGTAQPSPAAEPHASPVPNEGSVGKMCVDEAARDLMAAETLPGTDATPAQARLGEFPVPSASSQHRDEAATGAAGSNACPSWLLSLRAQHDLAAAAVLDAWAGVLQERQKGLYPKRMKRRSPESCRTPPLGQGQASPADGGDAGEFQLASGTSKKVSLQHASEVESLEDDMPTGVDRVAEGTPCAVAGAGTMALLASGNGVPSTGSRSTRETPTRQARPLLDDSDDAEDDSERADPGAGAAPPVPPCDHYQQASADEEAVTAAVVAEMVARCEGSEAVTCSPANASMQDYMSQGAAEPCTGPNVRPEADRHASAQAGASATSPDVAASSGVCAGFGSIAVLAAAAGLQAAEAAQGRACGSSAAVSPSTATASLCGDPPAFAPAAAPAGEPKHGSGTQQQCLDAVPDAPKRRGRPRKDTTKTAAAHAASRAAVVLQQGREAVSRHIDTLHKQAAELRSASSASSPMCHGVSESARGNVMRTGEPGAGDALAEVSQLQWACTVSEMVSASDAYSRRVAERCASGASGMPGEWLWMGEVVCDDGARVSDAKAASGLHVHEAWCAPEEADQAISGVSGALWGCCGLSVPGGVFGLARQERSLVRRIETVDRVRWGTRDCSRNSVFRSWHALGCMAHDESAAQLLEGAASRRTRRKRGHCAEAVFVWDMEVADINAAALTWSPMT